jgi:hypothetical protein
MTNAPYSHRVSHGLAASVFNVSTCSASNGTDSQTLPPPTNPSNTKNNSRTLMIELFAEGITSAPDQYTTVNVHGPYKGEVTETNMQIPYNDIDALARHYPIKMRPLFCSAAAGL